MIIMKLNRVRLILFVLVLKIYPVASKWNVESNTCVLTVSTFTLLKYKRKTKTVAKYNSSGGIHICVSQRCEPGNKAPFETSCNSHNEK